MEGLARVWSVALHGVDGVPVEIEAAIGGGIPGVHLVGLPDAALNEAKDRVRSAIVHSGRTWPNQRIVLALSPATLRKTGSRFDLALACAVLTAAELVPPDRLRGTVLVGELALDGRLRPVRGVLPCLLAARDAGMARAIVPRATLAEAALVDGLASYGAETLTEVLDWATGAHRLERVPTVDGPGPAVAPPELADVLGQDDARRALEIAAAGGHHLLMVGPPGTGKTMLAQRIVGLLPELGRAEALQLAAIRSVAGRLADGAPLSTLAPFVAPHHSASAAALLGGGSGVARPGAVSLAHRGVLFLDECPHWSASVLDSLRTPLEEGEVRLSRADGTVHYPARFQLVLAANPCPCAPPVDRECTCRPDIRRRYMARLSGPLLDRVDLRVAMEPVTGFSVTGGRGEPTAAVRDRVLEARAAAGERWSQHGWRCNAEVPGTELRTRFPLAPGVLEPLEKRMRAGELSARGADRALRVAWTLSDLAGAERPGRGEVDAALYFRERSAA
ncbi:magnesium chelatase family protein [Pseudonocardia ammonioxydans]|uniref:Magnesium chelatase family protein n=1 Tax=Pseudonocardia ammonioxydans TaxID=260086 RepID=A0A1I4T943_PSUAM|nr:YifB family Mg chelatase-like AAA ATPase [Pseudonocardia ammonioxydans]SFM73077.1 magnesium chelatase family protein [Pseudonocardia ammonioxydans]